MSAALIWRGRPMWTIENRVWYDRSRLRYPSDLTDEEWLLIETMIHRRPHIVENTTTRHSAKEAEGFR